MAQSAKAQFGRALDFWLARGAVLVIVGLQIAIVNDLTIGPRWLAPAVELALLIPLTIATAWTQRRARKASTKEQISRVWRGRLQTRRLRYEARLHSFEVLMARQRGSSPPPWPLLRQMSPLLVRPFQPA